MSEKTEKTVDYAVDSEDFYFNKSDLVVTIEPRERQPLKVDDDVRLPAYMRTYIEELSRDCCVYYMSPNGTNTIKSVSYGKEESAACFPLNEETVRVTMDQLKAQHPQDNKDKDSIKFPILQHYHPEYQSPPSSYRREPSESLRKALQPEPYHNNLLLNVGPIVMPNGQQVIPPFKSRVKFEPIFGSATIYAIVPTRKGVDIDGLIRVTETFRFDITDESLKNRYPEVYNGGRPEVGLEIPRETSDPALDLTACMFSIPPEYDKSELYLVIQLSKVLTGDGDKAASPYMRASGAPETHKHEESCRRLHNFRQPLAISIWRLFDDSGLLIPSPKSHHSELLSPPFYSLRTCINDSMLKQVGSHSNRLFRPFIYIFVVYS